MQGIKLAVRYIFCFFLLFISSCNNEEQKQEEQQFPFTISNEGELQGKLGQEIPVKLQVNDKLKVLVAIQLDDTLKIWKNVKGSFIYNFNTVKSGIGKYDIKFIGETEKGKSFDQTVTLDVLSDLPFNVYETTVRTSFSHLPTSFTQGLEFDGDQLYEGTGDPSYTGATYVAKVDFKTGSQSTKVSVPIPNFGEGITIMDDKLYQLTWQQQICFVYDKNTLKKIGEFKYEGEGWGLCNDGEYLIMSNGSSTLTFRNPITFEVVKTIQVATDKSSVSNLNELEFVNGLIYANVWQEDILVSIEPSTGRVKDLINCFNIVNQIRSATNASSTRPEVLNGIAYKKSTKTFFLTGKYWPTLFEVTFSPKNT